MLLQTIFPIAIGAIIGYCTNYIAIRMLFHPYKEVRIGKWRLPFTPGIIPKNQGRIARTVGNAVSSELVTAEALLENSLQGAEKTQLVAKMAESICESDIYIDSITGKRQDYSNTVDMLSTMISEVIVSKLGERDWQPVIEKMGQEALGDYLKNPFLSMIINEDVKRSIYEKIGAFIKDYINENGEELLKGFAVEQLTELGSKTVGETLRNMNIEKETLENILTQIFERGVSKYGKAFMNSIDISSIVSDRINAMDMRELEQLVMSVMKRELQAVINLGALIGAVIGILNIFIR